MHQYVWVDYKAMGTLIYNILDFFKLSIFYFGISIALIIPISACGTKP